MTDSAILNSRLIIKRVDHSTFETTIICTKFKVLVAIKKWYEINKINRIVCHTGIDVIDAISFIDGNMNDSIDVRGIVLGELDNENSIFNEIYSFMYYMMTECSQKTLLWRLNETIYTVSSKN